jgi:hypothetical protein
MTYLENTTKIKKEISEEVFHILPILLATTTWESLEGVKTAAELIVESRRTNRPV